MNELWFVLLSPSSLRFLAGYKTLFALTSCSAIMISVPTQIGADTFLSIYFVYDSIATLIDFRSLLSELVPYHTSYSPAVIFIFPLALSKNSNEVGGRLIAT